MSNEEPIFNPKSDHCALCGGSKVVDVIPRGGGYSDARKDECPWCLRRRQSTRINEKTYIGAAIRGGGILTVRSAIEGKAIYIASVHWSGNYGFTIKSEITTTIEAALNNLDAKCEAHAKEIGEA